MQETHVVTSRAGGAPTERRPGPGPAATAHGSCTSGDTLPPVQSMPQPAPLDVAVPGGSARDVARARMLEEVRAGLAAPQKTLPSKYFYDARGSALFERITELPEYYLTRAERRLLTREMPRWASRLAARTVVELGAGSASKTRLVLDALREAGTLDLFVPVDVSGDFLELSARALRREYPALRVLPVTADFTHALALPDGLPRPLLAAFLGSTLGNFPPPEAADLLRHVAGVLERDDHFLLGADLRKDVAVLEAAYDDAAGVTAAFNRNILLVVNDALGTDFVPHGFRHRALYDPRHHRIEMHLVAEGPQEVHLPGAGVVRIADGESIRTEVSYKYDRAEVERLLGEAGLVLREWATDEREPFALALAGRPR